MSAPVTPKTTFCPIGDDQFAIVRTQDVEPVLEQAKKLAAETTGRSKSGDLHHAAEFPMVIIEKYLSDNNVTFEQFMADPEHVRRMLQDPALAGFRVFGNVVHKTWR